MYLPHFHSAILRSPALLGEDAPKSIRIQADGYKDLHVRCDDNSKFTKVLVASYFITDVCVQLLDNCSHVYIIGDGSEKRLLSVVHDNHCKEKVESRYNDRFKVDLRPTLSQNRKCALFH